jgi:hypothetical protein
MFDPDLHLFVNEEEISLKQRMYRMIHPVRREEFDPVLSPNGEDEGTAIGYASVVRDEENGVYRMWYMCHADSKLRGAVSEDGREWERRGGMVVNEEQFALDNMALVELGPDVDEWFEGAKLVGYGYGKGSGKDGSTSHGLHMLRSMDGERVEMRVPGILPGVGDRSSLVFDELTGEYSLISRPSGRTPGFRKGELVRVRTGNLWKSRDLVDWENLGVVVKYDEQDRHDVEIYGIQPFRYGAGWLGLVEVYFRGRERLETQLAWSEDGMKWERVEPRDPVLRMGGEGAWDSHWVVSTNNPPFLVDDRLMIFYSGAGTKHGSKNRHKRGIGLASLRRDGWVSLEAGREEGVVVTAPLPLEKPMQLELNANAYSGYVSVEVMAAEEGKESQALEGYEGEASMAEGIDAVRHPVHWGEKRVIEPVECGRCYLRFAMKQASFFSYRWSAVE